MSAEIFRSELSFWQRKRMAAIVNKWLAADMGFRKAFDLVTSLDDNKRDEDLLAYYTAYNMRPTGRDEDYANIGAIHNLIARAVMQSVFHEKAPNFNQQQNRYIIHKALWIAKLRWQAIIDDSDQEDFKRNYATVVIADIDARLEAIDLASI